MAGSGADAKMGSALAGSRSRYKPLSKNSAADKVIGSSLEAVVEIQANPDTYGFLKSYESDLSALFIVSGAKLKEVHHARED